MPGFQCETNDTEMLAFMCHCLLLERKEQVAFIQLASAGIKVVVEKAKTLQAKAYFKKSTFQTYSIEGEDSHELFVDFRVVSHCLSLFPESTHLDMSYPDTDGLHDKRVSAACEVKTVQGIEPFDFSFRSHSVVNRVIVKACILREALYDLEARGATNVELIMSPVHPFVSFKVTGDASSCELVLPQADTGETFSLFDCKQTRRYFYNLQHFRSCFRAVNRSEHVNLRMNDMGLLSLQFVVKSSVNPSVQNWIEYLLCAEEVIPSSDDEA